ncbi:MAG TPA: hypothetical protein VK752_05365 [Bryobacteraceae bacterium]|jgi:hypothetical protein|nr:hypothetical protein [Bryobacteraceae bacterium]
MMRREGGRVVIDISEEEYTLLLLKLGYATGRATDMADRNACLRLANAINEGNPQWTPYEVLEN